MYRSLAAIGLSVVLFQCSTAQKSELDLEQTGYQQLIDSELAQKIQEKEERYRRASKKSKYDLELSLGYLQYRQHNVESAKAYFQRAVKRKGVLVKDYAYFYLGKMALEGANCEESSSYVSQLEQEFPDEMSTRRLRTLWNEQCIKHVKRPPKSRRDLIRKIKLDLYKTAIESFEEKDYRKAIPQFKEYLFKVSPDHPQVESALLKLALIYKRTGRKDNYLRILKSLSKYRKASKRFPYNPRWIYEIARYYWNRESIRKAQKNLKALISWPYHRYVGRSYFILAKIEGENQRYRKALSYLTKASVYVINSGRQEEIAYLKGWYAYKIKDFRQATIAFESFRNVYPESDYFERVTYWLGRCSLHLNETAKANGFFQNIAVTAPYSYYGILSKNRLKEPVAVELEPGYGIQFSNKKKEANSELVAEFISSPAFKRAKKLITLGLGEDGAYELQAAIPRRRLLKAPWSFQYYTSALYQMAGDYISSFVILNDLQNKNVRELPKEHLRVLYPKQFWSLITKYAQKYQLDPYFLLSIMRQESAFDPEAISTADAFGLLQITPFVAKAMGKRLGRPLASKSELLEPDTNLFYSTYYISELLKKYKGNLILSLATYNANDRAVRKWVKRYGVPDHEEFIEEIPYAETRNYVKLILRNYTNNVLVHEGRFQIYPEKSQPISIN